MGGNLKVWVFNFRGKIFGGNTTVYISSGETNTVYPGAKGQLRVMSTEKGQKMTLKMGTEGNKIPLNFKMRVIVKSEKSTFSIHVYWRRMKKKPFVFFYGKR